MPTDPETPGNEPNLELPSFGFGRRKKRGKRPTDDAIETTPAPSAPGPEETVEEEPPAAEATTPLPTTPRAPAAPPAPLRAPDAASTPGPTPARPPARPAARPPSRPTAAAAPAPAPAPARPAPARPVPPQAPAEPADTAATGSVEGTPPAASAPPAPPVVPPAAAPLPPVTDGEPTDSVEPFIETPVVDPLDEAAAALDAPRRARPRRQETRAQRRAEKKEAKRARKDAREAAREDAQAEPVLVEPAQDDTTDAEPTAVIPAEALVARLPAINPGLAAVITGVLSGLTTVLLAFGAARGCDAVRGTESCGGGLGLLALVAILALEVFIGASLLKAWQISDPVSTSFLGVGIVATIAMLAFLDSIDSPSMLVVIPLMTGASFALSWWVTVRFVDEHPMTSEADAEHGEPPFRRAAADQDEDTNA